LSAGLAIPSILVATADFEHFVPVFKASEKQEISMNFNALQD
jgi:hypothetical protein